MWLLIALLVIVGMVAALPLLAEARRRLPDQSRAPGEMVALPQGRTHALWLGPARGPVVVAVHGLTTPSPVWNSMAAGLADIGYRVLVYDLYGRGYSDNATGAQGPDFHVAQLLSLMDHFGLTEDVTLMGYSMGGGIATAFAARHPERLKRLILVAPSGMAVTESPAGRRARQTPLLGDWFFVTFAARHLRERSSGGGTSEVAGITEIQNAELSRRGFLPAVLSSLRHMVHLQQEEDHRMIGRAGIPVVALWGEEDRTIPLRGLGMLSAWNRAVKQEVIAGAGHGLPHTHGQAAADLLRDILREDWE